ncbi:MULTISPECIES: FAD-dependent oxidoreductase [Xanthomonas]|uniref:FAD-dependent oxidoreductase n=1 Tax=Xanthomonas TaxID=338 RepID=UPI00096D1505|nr:NAD(P)/FAD-dependent oxidoreductase [Xanthomonas campestris]MCC5066806.1 FAD-dependent monooxygenase [Xanthomonas campestris]MCC5084084.1 FAD-dependent monooxygenase [Xanthomonas campestris]MCC5089473.1 FAD-dependent monooxygenase [Xanthomonas campestris]MCC5092467.1 FAD-dependent monooxygenase [Xanthomonas campestris pv. incanae]MCC8485188.1 FAD-dependent monooxygenase [Xanthomonas campestris]
MSAAASPRSLTLIGAGLAGCLLAILLSRRGWQITLYERRGDPRIKGYESGRSINLALAERGRHALRQAGAEDAVMAKAVMMRGRMIHPVSGEPQLQRYGRDDSEVIWSIHRAALNVTLLDLAEQAGARVHFYRRLHTVDFDAGYARFIDDRDDQPHEIHFQALVGSDGAGSALRAAMQRKAPVGEHIAFLDHSYKELEIPPRADGGFRIERNALHIWPRGRYMCIALPNDGGTFTVTLFLPNEGTPSFATTRSGDEALALFARDFPDALPLIPQLKEHWEEHPPGLLGTLTRERWHLDGRAVLLGDAAHAMVPFHGQGMNCAFEDCVALAEQLDAHSDLGEAFAAFEAARRDDAAAIQQMALENYLEMRDRVGDAQFLLQRALEQELQARWPTRFVPHYTMVTFLRTRYAIALARSEIQREILVEATHGHTDLSRIDWAALETVVHARLEPLEGAH